MGTYLSKPLTDKTSSDDVNEQLSFGASSMQGWRASQEDAHNTILNFDKNVSLFAVYDGHGGSQVAKYCEQKLPNFIKNTEEYKNGKLEDALKSAFLGFDATISTAEFEEFLKTLPDDPDTEADHNDTTEDEEEVSNLRKEASMPLDIVMAKYPKLSKITRDNSDNPVSPYLRSKRPGSAGDSGAGCSSTAASSVENDSDVTSSTKKNSDEAESSESQTTSNGKKHSDDIKEKKETDIPEPDSAKQVPDTPNEVSESTTDSKKTKELISNCNDTEQNNGKLSENESKETEDVSSSSHENGEVKPSPSKKGKALAKSSGVSSTESPETEKPIKAGPENIYNSLLALINDASEKDDSDSNDETFDGQEDTSSSDEEKLVNGDDVDSSDKEMDDDDDDDSGEEDDSEEFQDDDMSAFMMMGNEPGANSGCTAVVALLQGNQLFVANAGDSRCVVCRSGQALEMSIDHKPEDEAEKKRIESAGGKVSSDGRVNGGLNLSRAIGDLAYKKNTEVEPKDQMISAMPDVKTVTIDPTNDEFMVLACDGIWNSMSSQEVVNFVKDRLDKGTEKISQICEEMFDHCLAPNASGDGTGCDNMTAIIVIFKPIAASKKRQSEDEEKSQSKRAKTDEDVTVSSSV